MMGDMQRIGEPMMSGSASYQASARRRPNFWLRLASAGWDGPQVTVEQREALRRGELQFALGPHGRVTDPIRRPRVSQAP